MAGRMTNISKLFSNLRTRNIIILTGIILSFIVVVGIFGLRRASTNAESGSLAKAPRVESVPGLTTPTPEVARMVEQINQAGSEKAAKKGTSFFPTFIGQGDEETTSPTKPTPPNTSSTTMVDNPFATKPQQQQPGGSADIAASQKQLAQQQQQLAQQVQEMQAKQEQQQQQQTQDNMTRQAQKIMTAWGATDKGTPVQQYVELQVEQTQESTTVVKTGASSTTTEINKTTEPLEAATIKAGDVMFAVLITAINSDEPGPIMAKIVSGPLKGSKLVGKIEPGPTLPGTNGPTALTLTFRDMNVPDLDNSVSINAVAIDQDTARTSVATDVDHHYFLRYGSLFASSFLQGYGQAITQSGSITFNNASGEQTTFAQQLTPKEEFLAALGEVGQQWGEDIGDILNRPNTVYVDSGTGVGILFLADVVIK